LNAGYYLSIDGGKVATIVQTPAQLRLTGWIGNQLRIHAPAGQVLKTWEISRGMQQLIIHKEMLGMVTKGSEIHPRNTATTCEAPTK
jgi:hypothetical protein